MDELFSGANDVICLCKDITCIEIKNAIKDGADTFEKIMDRTGAGVVCGKCRKHIKMILDEEEALL